MTDNRIDKIRAEIERQYKYHKDHADDYAGTEHFWKADEDRNLLSFIDSLQKEHKFKTGDRIKPIDSCLGSPRTILKICDSWYITDQGTLDFEYEDNWELAEEHKKCMYSKDNYTNEDRKALCDGCEEDCKYAQKEESVGKRFAFKAIPRLLEMIEPTDRAKAYIAKLANALEVEGYSTDAKIVMERLKIMNGEKVPMATMDEEPVSEELEEAAHQYYEPNDKFMDGFKKGAKWQKSNLWKPADGDDLPIIDREVIALLDNGKVVFAHRPPEYWDGKNIITGKVTRNYPKTYDKGGWNIPDVKWWLDCLMPKEIEL